MKQKEEMNDDGLGHMTNKQKKKHAKRMDSKRDRKRMNVEQDRLSSLPGDLIHKILSFIGIKHVVQTSVFSSRWRFIWTSMPYLDFSSEDFSTLLKFSNFVKHVIHGLENEIEVSHVKLSFRGKPSQVFVKRIMDYAFSHNVQEMSVRCLENSSIEFPLSLFGSRSLVSLSLIGSGDWHTIKATSTWELPALTTLHLKHVRLFDDTGDNCIALFTKCLHLKNLTLISFKVIGSSGFSICHPQLSNLTLKGKDMNPNVITVVAPQLKNLSLEFDYKSFACFPDGLPSLEKVDLCMHNCYKAREIVGLLQQFHAVKSLTLNMDIIEFLSSSLELISNQPSPFVNLKSLKIYPVSKRSVRQTHNKVDVSPVVKTYLLDGSPNATFTIVSHKEMKAVKNTTLALEHIPKLRVLLDELKTDLDQGKAPKESSKAKLRDKGKAKVQNKGVKPGKKMPQIRSCWDDLSVQMNHEKKKVSRIFLELEYMEGLLTHLLASQRVRILACFASMCEEADTLMNKIINRMKIQCDMKRSHLSMYFGELTKALPLS